QIDFPHSLGLLYSAFTYYAGFKVNSGEYKLMGLAPYGEPRYVDLIREHIIDIKEDGSFRLNMSYFNYCTGLTMTNDRFHDLFGGPPRKPETPLTQRDMDIAASIQKVTEDIVLRLARTLRKQTGCTNLCLAGGAALNWVANGILWREKVYDNLWIQPAAGDAGGAIGAALVSSYERLADARPLNGRDAMSGSFLGPRYDAGRIAAALDARGAVYEILDEESLYPRVAKLL